MGNSLGKFIDNDPYVQTGLTLTAYNNVAAANAAVGEVNQLQATGLSAISSSVNTTLATPSPDVAIALQGTIGAALAGIGQSGTPSTEPDSPGIQPLPPDFPILE